MQTRVNKDHYSVEFDQTIVNLTTEIKSLKAKITMLEVELELEREPKKGPPKKPFCILAPCERFELPTNWFEANYSIQLS